MDRRLFWIALSIGLAGAACGAGRGSLVGTTANLGGNAASVEGGGGQGGAPPLVCSGVLCLNGLGVSFEGFASGAAYDVTISSVTPDGTSPTVLCMIKSASDPAPGQQLFCSSTGRHWEIGTLLHIEDTSSQTVQVTVASGGTQLLQQTYAVPWQFDDGGGCGSCTYATIHVALP